MCFAKKIPLQICNFGTSDKYWGQGLLARPIRPARDVSAGISPTQSSKTQALFCLNVFLVILRHSIVDTQTWQEAGSQKFFCAYFIFPSFFPFFHMTEIHGVDVTSLTKSVYYRVPFHQHTLLVFLEGKVKQQQKSGQIILVYSLWRWSDRIFFTTMRTAKYLLWNRANNGNEKHHDLKFTPRFTHPDILFEIHPRQFSTELVKRSYTSGTINNDKPYHVEAVIIHQQDFILLFEINGFFTSFW